MTNAEKYKSDYDRFEGFNKFCNSHECITCPIITLGIKEPCELMATLKGCIFVSHRSISYPNFFDDMFQGTPHA